MPFGLVEEIAHAAGADADEHLDELRAGDAEEGHRCFSGNRLRQQGLARARRAHQQDAFGDPRAEVDELLRVFEEFDDFAQLGFGFLDAGDILESDGGAISAEHAGATLAE